MITVEGEAGRDRDRSEHPRSSPKRVSDSTRLSGGVESQQRARGAGGCVPVATTDRSPVGRGRITPARRCPG